MEQFILQYIPDKLRGTVYYASLRRYDSQNITRHWSAERILISMLKRLRQSILKSIVLLNCKVQIPMSFCIALGSMCCR